MGIVVHESDYPGTESGTCLILVVFIMFRCGWIYADSPVSVV